LVFKVNQAWKSKEGEQVKFDLLAPMQTASTWDDLLASIQAASALDDLAPIQTDSALDNLLALIQTDSALDDIGSLNLNKPKHQEIIIS
jgi:hypothetical protein